MALAARINAALPQTQCTRCGYPDCQSYADAIAKVGIAINRCPPGGVEGIERLANITGRTIAPLDPECGNEGPRAMAVIDEQWCIGCTLCLDVCPTDAILGINKRMHTVIETHCTGCELCLPVCPVDCISLDDVTPGRTGWQAWSTAQADDAQRRYASRLGRLAAEKQRKAEVVQAAPDPTQRKRSIVEAALARARDAAAAKAS
jgi:electron transport complex protein RnfB